VTLSEVDDIFHVSIGPYGYHERKIGRPFGCFFSQGHLFIVSGSNYIGDLFRNTRYYRKVNYIEDDDAYDPSTGKIIIESYEDDSWSNWHYILKEDKFILVGFSTTCNK
jgi:hypothetical protein